MTKPNLTHISLILDRSGSMAPLRSDTIGGVNTFLAAQRKAPGEATVSLTQFNDSPAFFYVDKPIAAAPDLTETTYAPSGNTALFDAVGLTIHQLGAKLAAKPEEERPSKIIVVIITDGHENASREYNQAQIHAMIKEQTEVYAWEFLFLGANIDAVKAGASIGVKTSGSMNYTPSSAGTKELFSTASASVLRGRSGASMDITQAERDANKTP